jgi:hypothetical protein
VFVEVYDDDQPAVVWLFAGRHNADGDHVRWLTAMQRLDAVAGTRGGGALLIIDDGNPPPPPSLRGEIAAVARRIRGTSPLAVVTSSSVARLIIAGLHATGVAGFPIQGHKSVDDAIAWLATASSKVRAPELRTMVDEARARAARASG